MGRSDEISKYFGAIFRCFLIGYIIIYSVFTVFTFAADARLKC
jgi:hypothetical protein